MIQGVLFDMDGLLLDSERPAEAADVEAAALMGYTLPPEILAQFVGANDTFISGLIEKTLGPGFDFKRFREIWRECLARRWGAAGPPPMPGAAQALHWLRQQGYPMAVASSSPRDLVESRLQSAGFLAYFSALVPGDEVPHSKPAPDIFLLAAKKLGLAPKQCLALEDSHNGVRSAAAAGCVTVMVPDGQAATEEMQGLCAAVLPSLKALPELVQKFENNAL